MGKCRFRGIFARKLNLLNPKFWNMLREVVRFKKAKHDVLEGPRKEYWEKKTLGDYLSENKYSIYFREHYVLPMARRFGAVTIKMRLGFR